jgi:hypothetical protein
MVCSLSPIRQDTRLSRELLIYQHKRFIDVSQTWLHEQIPSNCETP